VANQWFRHVVTSDIATGDKDLFDEATPMLEVMGKRSFFLGKVGHNPTGLQGLLLQIQT
jgi:hypothetical protein